MRHSLLSILLVFLTACVGSPPPDIGLQATVQALRTQVALTAPTAPLPLPTSAGQASGTPPAPTSPLPSAPLTPSSSTRMAPMGTITPQSGHPRLWIRSTDLPRLRSWAVQSNPLFRDGLALVAEEAKSNMDAGRVPKEDGGTNGWEHYPTEMYAELFAYMSLISSDPPARDDYALRARSLLMHVIDQAAKGPAAGQPFRAPEFAGQHSDRARWWGEGFAVTVDWIYPYLNASDKAAIQKVFVRWAREIVQGGYHHPEPPGVVNDPLLVKDQVRARRAGNNYFTAHMRNLGLMALALDPADDPGNQLGQYLSIATGAHLYMVDYLVRNDARGGLMPEGFEYSPQTVAYIVQFLLALHTAGRDDPAVFGPQVSLLDTSFPNDLVTADLHSLSPAPAMNPDAGLVYQPAWYGDGQHYYAPDFIAAFGPLGLYDRSTGNSAREAAVRWIQTHMAPGGADKLAARAARPDTFLSAIFYFMLFDPGAPAPSDPRPNLPLVFHAPGIGKLLARTDWTPQATWFTYRIGWNTIDHQHADGNQFEFYRRGEWLTKERTGYDISSSDYHNSLALQNNPPQHNDPSGYRHDLWVRGSQWILVPSGDGRLVAQSSGKSYFYALGDATSLYNSEYESSTDIVHASRSIVWLQPDHIIVYDRAASKTANRFKRFWLNLPESANLSGKLATMTTKTGQQLFITTLLPADAAIGSERAESLSGVASSEPMQFRLRVEAPGGPQNVRFLHVLQGADPGASPTRVSLIQTTGDAPFAGTLVGNTAVLFPVDVGAPPVGVTYTVPAGVTAHLITGLAPNGGYDVTMQGAGNNLQVTIRSGSTYNADAGGVLVIGTLAP